MGDGFVLLRPEATMRSGLPPSLGWLRWTIRRMKRILIDMPLIPAFVVPRRCALGTEWAVAARSFIFIDFHEVL